MEHTRRKRMRMRDLIAATQLRDQPRHCTCLNDPRMIGRVLGKLDEHLRDMNLSEGGANAQLRHQPGGNRQLARNVVEREAGEGARRLLLGLERSCAEHVDKGRDGARVDHALWRARVVLCELPEHVRGAALSVGTLAWLEQPNQLLGNLSLVVRVEPSEVGESVGCVLGALQRAVVEQLHKRCDTARLRNSHLVRRIFRKVPQRGRRTRLAGLATSANEPNQRKDATSGRDRRQTITRLLAQVFTLLLWLLLRLRARYDQRCGGGRRRLQCLAQFVLLRSNLCSLGVAVTVG